jgi:hypothetical protein
VLKGETQWNWRVDPKGRFHVYVDYENELLVMGAIRVAERIINALDNREIDELDISQEIEELRKLAKLGQELRDPSHRQAKLEPAAQSA